MSRSVFEIRLRLAQWKPEAFSTREVYEDCEVLLIEVDRLAKRDEKETRRCTELFMSQAAEMERLKKTVEYAKQLFLEAYGDRAVTRVENFYRDLG